MKSMHFSKVYCIRWRRSPIHWMIHCHRFGMRAIALRTLSIKAIDRLWQSTVIIIISMKMTKVKMTLWCLHSTRISSTVLVLLNQTTLNIIIIVVIAMHQVSCALSRTFQSSRLRNYMRFSITIMIAIVRRMRDNQYIDHLILRFVAPWLHLHNADLRIFLKKAHTKQTISLPIILII